MHRLLCFLVLLLAGSAAAAESAESWMSVVVDGRKVGSVHAMREVAGNEVTNTQTLRLVFERDGTRMEMLSTETNVETTQGEPLAFHVDNHLSGSASTIDGKRQEDGRFRIRRTIGGHSTDTIETWPAGALLAEGQQRALMQSGLRPGSSVSFNAYGTLSAQALHVTRTVQTREHVTLPGGEEDLLRIESVTRLPVGETRSTSWVNDAGETRKLRMQVAGITLDMLACSQACAEAPEQAADIFTRSMVVLPRALKPGERVGRLRYHVVSLDDEPLYFRNTDEQRVTNDRRGGWRIEVGAANARRLPPPAAEDTAANAWLEAGNAEIIAAARKAVAGARDDAGRMRRLTDFVRTHIETKNLSVGYATALETLRSREGDCTEHAVLLAALARAVGIPARIATGLAYAPAYAGTQHVLVPHAWVIAWVDGHWHSHDAALGRFDAGHIAIDVGDGDPWKFFSGIDTLGRLRIDAVRALDH